MTFLAQLYGLFLSAVFVLVLIAVGSGKASKRQFEIKHGNILWGIMSSLIEFAIIINVFLPEVDSTFEACYLTAVALVVFVTLIEAVRAVPKIGQSLVLTDSRIIYQTTAQFMIVSSFWYFLYL